MDGRDRMFHNGCGIVGIPLGVALTMFVHPMAQYWVSGGFAALCVLIAARMKETLAPEQRRPFRWSGANPLSNVLLLMRNGPGLRRLTISATLLMIRNTHWSIVGAYRFGSLGPPLSAFAPLPFPSPRTAFPPSSLCRYLSPLTPLLPRPPAPRPLRI